MFLSDFAFTWMLSAMVIALAGVWSIYEVRNLVRLGRDKPTGVDLEHRDRVFGSIIGLALSTMGFFGFLNFHYQWI